MLYFRDEPFTKTFKDGYRWLKTRHLENPASCHYRITGPAKNAWQTR